MATAREHSRRESRPHRNGSFRAHFQNAAQHAGTEAEDYASDVLDQTQRYVNAGRTYVAGHPAKSVSIAAGVGILVGMLILALRPRN